MQEKFQNSFLTCARINFCAKSCFKYSVRIKFSIFRWKYILNVAVCLCMSLKKVLKTNYRELTVTLLTPYYDHLGYTAKWNITTKKLRKLHTILLYCLIILELMEQYESQHYFFNYNSYGTVNVFNSCTLLFQLQFLRHRKCFQ